MAKRKPSRRLAALLAATLAVVSGIALFGRRAAAPQTAASGRGKPTVPASPQATSLGYETEDISASMVGRILAGFAATVIVSITVLFVMIHFFHRADNTDQPTLTAQQSADIVPPGPQLQSDPYRDLRNQHGAEEQKLAGYAWADPAHTRARIPIGRAMALVAGRSLEPSP